MHNKINALRTF
jgi:hypothetical protein